MEVTVEDTLWLSDQMIWKFDLTDFEELYGIQLIHIRQTADGTVERRRIGGFKSPEPIINTKQSPLLKVGLTGSSGTYAGKLSQQGVGGFDFSLLFEDDSEGYCWRNQFSLKKGLNTLFSNNSSVFFSDIDSITYPHETIAIELIVDPDD